jgi:hypothetical protein
MEENRVEGRREFQMMQSHSSDCDSALSRRAAAVANGPNGGAEEQERAVPCHYSNRQPTNTHLLWEEYEHGIAGRKAARLLQERRGRVKHKYCRRKLV